MSIKTILVPFFGYDEELASLETAFELGKRHKAHITVWHISPDPLEYITAYAGTGYVGPFYDDALIRELEQPYLESKNKARQKYDDLIAEKNILTDFHPKLITECSASFMAAKGDAAEILQVQARLADLVVLTRPWDKNVGRTSDVLNHCLFNSGKPILVVPPNSKAPALHNKAAIAWDASPETARTIALAMPMLENCTVSVITVMSDKARDFPLPAEDISMYLTHHNIKSDVIWCDVSHSVEESLLTACRSVKADFLVMGAYTRSRLKEVIFGGTTDYMLNNADIPILISH